MDKPVIVTSKKGERLEIAVKAVPGWEGFDELISYLIQHYEATVLKELDGPDARRWILKCHDQIIEVHHDDMFGNYLFAPTLESEEVIREIAQDLGERFSNI